MENTTLHTFLFYCPAALRTVVLLGSWDNFSRPYPLELDARRGCSFWKGCFTFSDIICDGNLDEQPSKRDGLLMMGGKYWYHYKVDEDEECHDPTEPSTTICPLLPGQRLNVLEIPTEKHCRSHSDTPAFTRNPKDRYLTPVPPASWQPASPRIGAPSPISSPMPPPSPWAPRSATYPPADRFLSPNVIRHARSASASPHMPSTPVFPDFKVLKEKLASKRAAARARSSSTTRELEIGSPMLISSSIDDLNLIPLAVYQPSPAPSPRPSPGIWTPATRSVPSIRREFCPLGSHPVDANEVHDPNISELPAEDVNRIQRRRSHVPSAIISSEFRLGQGRIRANSTDTRRTQHYLFSNDPWLSSPKLQEEFEAHNQLVDDDTPAAPTLQRHASYLDLPQVCERPTSSHATDFGNSLRQVPLEKELPALPQYIKPPPLFVYNRISTIPVAIEQAQEVAELEQPDHEESFMNGFQQNARSHFSTWSSHSFAASYPTSDDEVVQSPTFSSLTSDCSGSPRRFSSRFSFAEQADESKRITITFGSEDDVEEEHVHASYLSSTPPQLGDLRISSFGSDLFNLDIQHSDATPRRQAACFGLGFQYSLPEDETDSKITLTSPTLQQEPTIKSQRGSSVSQLNALMADFAFLGESVI